jgi:hypothetical protein
MLLLVLIALYVTFLLSRVFEFYFLYLVPVLALCVVIALYYIFHGLSLFDCFVCN